MSDSNVIKKFLSLRDEKEIYEAGMKWSGLPQRVLDKKFMKLKISDYIFLAGRDWNVSNKARNKKFLKLSDGFVSVCDSSLSCVDSLLVQAVSYWRGLTDKTIEKKFYKLKQPIMIYKAGCHFNLTSEAKHKKLCWWAKKKKLASKIKNSEVIPGWLKKKIFELNEIDCLVEYDADYFLKKCHKEWVLV